MIALGIDPGEKRIGVAVSDELGRLASPLTVIAHTSLKADVARVGELASERKAERIVVGLPLNLNGSVGPAARRARRFANALRRNLGLPVELWDETLTTVEAGLQLRSASSHPERSRGAEGTLARREEVDKVAAAIILQSYLDAHRGAGE